MKFAHSLICTSDERTNKFRSQLCFNFHSNWLPRCKLVSFRFVSLISLLSKSTGWTCLGYRDTVIYTIICQLWVAAWPVRLSSFSHHFSAVYRMWSFQMDIHIESNESRNWQRRYCVYQLRINWLRIVALGPRFRVHIMCKVHTAGKLNSKTSLFSK